MSEENNRQAMSRYFEGRIANLKKGYSEEAEEAGETLSPLAVSTYEVVKVELCWGGPADGFLLHREGKEIVRGYYYYADWFFYEERALNDEEIQSAQDYFGIE